MRRGAAARRMPPEEARALFARAVPALFLAGATLVLLAAAIFAAAVRSLGS